MERENVFHIKNMVCNRCILVVTRLLEKAGFTSIVLTPKPDYVRNMQDWNDPLYKQIAETLPQGEEMADYVVRLSIEARK